MLDSQDFEIIRVRKGVSERLNYFIPLKDQVFYDLRYNFPLNYFNGVAAGLKLMHKIHGNDVALERVRG